MAAQLPSDVAIVVVLVTPRVVADRAPDQPQGRADLLQVLADLVDRLSGLVASVAAQLRDCVVDLGMQHSPDARADRLVLEEAIGGGVREGPVSCRW